MSERARRAVGLVVLAVLVAVGCTFAGLWQWQRGEERERAIDTLRANFSAAAVPLDELVRDPAAPLDPQDTWRPVTATGRYVNGATVLLRNRPVDGKPAFHLLAFFELSATGSPIDGALLVVDRGWIPIGSDATGAVEVPAPPSGELSIEVRVRPAEREQSRTAPRGQAHSIFPPQVLGSATDLPEAPWEVLSGVYGSLVAESVAPAVVPGPLPQPSTDYGPHRSYAMQWWMFAVGALVGFGVLAWRERRDEVDEPDSSADSTAPGDGNLPTDVTSSHPGRERADDGPPAAPNAPRRRRRPTAEEEEDALIDAQASETRSR